MNCVNEYTIEACKFYAINLQKANREEEARELLTKLLETSRQVFGPDYRTTKEVASALACVNTLHAFTSQMVNQQIRWCE